MKKLTLIFAAFIMFTSLSHAQYVFDKDNIGINAGIGLLGYDGYIPSIEASVEFGVIPTGDIGLVSFGGSLGYKYSSYEYRGYSDYNYSKFAFGARGAWHLHTFKSDKYDVYAGVGFSIASKAKWDEKDLDYTTGFNPYADIFVGGRMMFNPGFGLFAEVGYSQLSSARFGLTFVM